MLCRILDPENSRAIEQLDLGGGAAAPRTLSRQEKARSEPASEGAGWKVRLADTERQWETKCKEQYQTGYQAGFAAGQQQNAAAVQNATEKLAASLNELTTLRGRLRQSAEADLVKLAVAIARRVLRREISLDPEAITALVAHAVSRLNSRDVARVRTHPDLANALQRALAGKPAASLAIETDASLMPGSIVFETQLGALDASVETQLDEIERGLTDRLGGHK
jgi:flagellar assembly protein FliH